VKRIKNLVIINGGWVDLSKYDRVEEDSKDYGDHTELDIFFFKNGEVVRRLWNAPVDVEYEIATPTEERREI